MNAPTQEEPRPGIEDYRKDAAYALERGQSFISALTLSRLMAEVHAEMQAHVNYVIEGYANFEMWACTIDDAWLFEPSGYSEDLDRDIVNLRETWFDVIRKCVHLLDAAADLGPIDKSDQLRACHRLLLERALANSPEVPEHLSRLAEEAEREHRKGKTEEMP